MVLSNTLLCCWNPSCFPTMPELWHNFFNDSYHIFNWETYLKKKKKLQFQVVFASLAVSAARAVIYAHFSNNASWRSLFSEWPVIVSGNYDFFFFFDTSDMSREYDHSFSYKWLHTFFPTYCDTSRRILFEVIFYSVNSY